MTVHHCNLILRAGSQEKAVGKIVLAHQWGDVPIFHAFGDRSWMRVDTDGWSVAQAVYDHCIRVGVKNFAIYDKSNNRTYLATDKKLRDYGITTKPNKPSPWGANRTMPERLWQAIPGKLRLPFVPDHIREIIPVGVEDAPEQGDLFAEWAS